MSSRIERTPQQVDPLGTFSVWLIAPVAAAAALVIALWQTARQLDQVSSPPLAVAALALLLAASAALVWGALPSRAPFRRGRYLTVLALVVAAALCSSASQWGLNRMIQDDWGQYVIALLLTAMAQLRSPTEVVIASIASAVLVAATAAAQQNLLAVPASALIYAVVAAAPPIVIGFAAAAYGSNMLRATQRWRSRARAGMARLAPEEEQSATRAVQQAYVTTLNEQVAPLIERILDRNELTGADTDAAAAIAGALRGQAIGLSHTDWLREAIDRAGASELVAVAVVTPDAMVPAPMLAPTSGQLIEAVSLDQRAVTAALLADLVGAERQLPAQRMPVELTLRALATPRARLELRAPLPPGARWATRARLRPYLAVLRVISHGARLRVTGQRIEMEFGYDL